jgi:hypothetical protein
LIDGEQSGFADRATAVLGSVALHRVVLLIGIGALRRGQAQHSARVGSSGDAPCLTIGCRTMVVQAKRCM